MTRSMPAREAATLAAACGSCADVEQGADGGRVDARSRDARGERGTDHERREVADGVAPALVLLLGGDHVVGELGAGRSIAHGHEGRRRSRLAGGAHGLVRDPRAALVRDGDDHPVARRALRHLECRDRACVAPGRQVERLAHEPREPHRRVLRGAAAGRDDRLALGGRPAETLRELLQRRVRRRADDQPLGERRFGGDHLRHQVRRPRPELRHVGGRPRIGRAGQRFVQVASHGRIVGHAEGAAGREGMLRTA